MQKSTDCPPLTQKGLSALYSDAGVISFLIPPSCVPSVASVLRPSASFLEKEKRTMKKQRIIELAVKVIVAALTAFLTALGTTSCMGHGPF